MKHIYSLFVLVPFIFLFWASATTQPIKGKYLEEPYIIETTKSFDEVWSDLIDLFATQGMPIKIIDKASGIIISESLSFGNAYTREDAAGNLINKNAYAVIPDFKAPLGNRLEPDFINGDCNIRVKSQNGKTSISINLVNWKCQYTSPPTQYTGSSTTIIPVRSTGVFEKAIGETLK